MNHMKQAANLLRDVERNTGNRAWEVFRDWIECSAIAIQNACDLSPARDAREATYMAHVNRYGASSMSKFAEALSLITEGMENQFGDYLGDFFMSEGFGESQMGQFFTPYELSRTIAGVATDKEAMTAIIAENGHITLNEPACGSGGMVIAYAHAMRDFGLNPQTQLHVTAQDLDLTAVHMAYVQLSLLGIPAIVIHGNTLTLETRSVWYTPFHILHGWSLRAHRKTQSQTPNPETEEVSPRPGKPSDTSGRGSPPDLESSDQSVEAPGEVRGDKTQLAPQPLPPHEAAQLSLL